MGMKLYFIRRLHDSSNEVIDNLDARSIEDSLIKMNDCMLLGPESKVNCKLNHSKIELSCTL